MKNYYCYILSSKRNGTLYIGITSGLIKRVQEHRDKVIDGFTKEYNVNRLVFYEQTDDVYSAITREKQLKKWNRDWKIQLIEKENPDWEGLYFKIIL